jgi:uncharacterized SAM-binding protein YcdF (DUF218 family)
LRGISEAKCISRVRRKRNYKKIFVILLLILIVVQFVAVEGLIIFNGKSDKEVQADYLIVLGAAIEGETITPFLKARLDAGVIYLQKYPDAKVVVSGGQGKGEDITEAEAMRRYLVANGIDENRILLEPTATSTMENFKLSKRLIENITGEPLTEAVFVSNSFHILRSKMLARRNNLKAHAISRNPSDRQFSMYIREYFAFIKSLLVDW